jgi:hypothetical protein
LLLVAAAAAAAGCGQMFRIRPTLVFQQVQCVLAVDSCIQQSHHGTAYGAHISGFLVLLCSLWNCSQFFLLDCLNASITATKL